MKTHIKHYQILILSLLILLFTGCNDEPFFYTFRQPEGNIAKVEVCAFNGDENARKVLAEIQAEDIPTICNEISKIECHDYFPFNPSFEFGDVAICITYLDGEVEVFGIYNIGYITPAGEKAIPFLYFEVKDICDLIARYVDPDVLSEISEIFRNHE